MVENLAEIKGTGQKMRFTKRDVTQDIFVGVKMVLTSEELNNSLLDGWQIIQAGKISLRDNGNERYVFLMGKAE
ncbi:hypothetical protein FACS189490_04090 [Clostridia bacterium]|nr:hypothetical protein FACS189490_04090 [Clostridia bacterium]